MLTFRVLLSFPSRLLLLDCRSLAAYIDSTFGSVQGLKKSILTDFFKFAFDGSGADNFFDAGGLPACRTFTSIFSHFQTNILQENEVATHNTHLHTHGMINGSSQVWVSVVRTRRGRAIN